MCKANQNCKFEQGYQNSYPDEKMKTEPTFLCFSIPGTYDTLPKILRFVNDTLHQLNGWKTVGHLTELLWDISRLVAFYSATIKPGIPFIFRPYCVFS